MMEANLKEKWISALRSGDYEQGRFEFESDGHFCCLGVLCSVAGEPTQPQVEDDVGGNWTFVRGLVDDLSALNRLWQMNDGVQMPRHSFAEIADYIEENL